MPIVYHCLCSCYISPVAFLLSRLQPEQSSGASRPCTMECRVIGLTIQTMNIYDFRKVMGFRTRSNKINNILIT